MPLEHKQQKTVALKGTKKVRQCTSGNKTQITVLGCASAAGQVIPPMVVFAGKTFNHVLSEGEVPDTFYGISDSGWMDQELFASWFTCHFLKYAVSSRPFTLDLVRSAAEQDVIIFCLLPHMTADNQTLDTSCFGPWAPKYPLVPGVSRLLIRQSRFCHHQFPVFLVILSGVVTEHDNQQHHS